MSDAPGKTGVPDTVKGVLVMRRALFVLVSLLLLPSSAFATWSVIAVDRTSGRVVIASATCVDRDDQFLMGVQAVVVPGKGVAACQAGVDGTHKNQMLVFEELKKGTDPKRIIELLSADPAYQSRQFGILDLQGRSAGHSGLTNGYVSQDIQGQVPGTEIFYSIQGNILRAGQVDAERGAGVHQDRRLDHRSRDGGHGSGRRLRRRQPLRLPAVADRRHARRRFRATAARRTSPTSWRRIPRTPTATRTTTASTRCTSPRRSPAPTRDRTRSRWVRTSTP